MKRDYAASISPAKRNDLDRLLNRDHVAMMSGDSYRLRERRRAGIGLPTAKSRSEQWVRIQPAMRAEVGQFLPGVYGAKIRTSADRTRRSAA